MATPKVGGNGVNAMKKNLNPYGPDGDFRVQTNVSTADALFLRSLFPLGGVESLVLANFYKSYVNELKSHGIHTYSPENQRLAKELLFRHLAFVQAPRTGLDQHEPSATNGLQQPHQSVEDESSNPSEAVETRRGTGRGELIKRRYKETKKSAKEDKC
jgi:hypothetical protein